MPATSPATYGGGGAANSTPFQGSATTRSVIDLSFPGNRKQAAWELRRALDTGNKVDQRSLLVAWARKWGEAAMHELLNKA